MGDIAGDTSVGISIAPIDIIVVAVTVSGNGDLVVVGISWIIRFPSSDKVSRSGNRNKENQKQKQAPQRTSVL